MNGSDPDAELPQVPYRLGGHYVDIPPRRTGTKPDAAAVEARVSAVQARVSRSPELDLRLPVPVAILDPQTSRLGGLFSLKPLPLCLLTECGPLAPCRT
jgi:hypothetical protein